MTSWRKERRGPSGLEGRQLTKIRLRLSLSLGVGAMVSKSHHRLSAATAAAGEGLPCSSSRGWSVKERRRMLVVGDAVMLKSRKLGNDAILRGPVMCPESVTQVTACRRCPTWIPRRYPLPPRFMIIRSALFLLLHSITTGWSTGTGACPPARERERRARVPGRRRSRPHKRQSPCPPCS